MKRLPPGISVVVPVYESEESLEALVDRTSAVLDSIGLPWEMILVDDRSTDRSWAIVLELAAADGRIRGYRLARNSGQHNALLCGIRASSYDTTVTLDDDLQNPPEEIPRLLEKLGTGLDVVYGSPAVERHGFLRDLASRLTKMTLQQSLGVKTARNVSAFRVFRTGLREAFTSHSGPYVSIDVLLTWGTRSFGSVEVRHEPRALGRSHYTVGKLVTHAFNMITGFSTIPLEVASLMGFLFMFFGICVLAFVIGRYLIEGGSVPGFPFLASIISIFSGVQLFSLGVIGEYIARMHFRLMGIPGYTVAEEACPGKGEQE
jgi:undecaprenyl-phosphate 4-deoxy-4-formamido-L-arabinose transferase